MPVHQENPCNHAPLFLLPFNEVPNCSLSFPLAPSDQIITTVENPPTGAKFYRQCKLRRTGKDPLPSGEPASQFLLTSGDQILLQPEDNAHRPGVAQVLYFWNRPRAQRSSRHNAFARVKWYYRPEDLGQIPDQAVGEDEVFLSLHSDDCLAETIVGRCLVEPYVTWLQRLSSKPVPEQNGDTRRLVDDAMSDAMSTFADNYETAAVFYYYRRLYNPASGAFQLMDSDEWEEMSQESASDYDEHDLDFSDDDIAPSRTRKRRGNRVTRRSRHGRASHFLLPKQLGTEESIQCRDSQKAQIFNFLEEAVVKQNTIKSSSKCLYISGVPGTGKTASVREVIRDFQQRQWERMSIEFVEINAMGLSDSNMLYASLYQALTGVKELSPSQCAQKLNKYFREGRLQGGNVPRAQRMERRIVLILDEMDVLVSRGEKILYDVFDWSMSGKVQFALICISNTMNLPEKMIPRIGSRLGVNRLTFPPYTSDELKIILAGYIKSQDEVIYDDGALRLCAAKVGAVSGDVRRATQILKHAADITEREREGKKVVSAVVVNKAIDQLADGGKLRSVEQTSLFERLILLSSMGIRQDGSCGEMSSVLLSDIYEQARKHSRVLNLDVPSYAELEEACWELQMRSMITIEKAGHWTQSRMLCNIRDEDITFALKSCQVAAKVLGHKG